MCTIQSECVRINTTVTVLHHNRLGKGSREREGKGRIQRNVKGCEVDAGNKMVRYKGENRAGAYRSQVVKVMKGRKVIIVIA